MLIRTTSSTVGASLRPDSASSAPSSDGFSGTRRSTVKTAAASVGEVIAPSRKDSSHDRPSAKWANTATSATLTPTPTVARARPTPSDGRTSDQLRGETTFGQDHDEGGEPERLGRARVVEADAEHGLAEHDAHRKVDQQAGQTHPHRARTASTASSTMADPASSIWSRLSTSTRQP